MDCKPRKSPLFYAISILVILLIFGCALLLILCSIDNETSPSLDIQPSSPAKFRFWVQNTNILEQMKGEKSEARLKIIKNNDAWVTRMGGMIRRMLSGPGSFPPRCTAKCGRCSPCKPIHVPVPPGTPVTTEYYPEAWRCKCGNKLYMP